MKTKREVMVIRAARQEPQSPIHRDYKHLKISQTRSVRIVATIVFCLFIIPITAWAQNNAYMHSNASLAEKVYLQLDRKVYTTGDIVWFKSIVLNAFNHIPSALSRVLYVELIRPDENIQEKKLIQIQDGVGQGFFYLDKSVTEGLYLIRAYTQWNRNFESDFFFKEYIHVFAQETNSINIVLNDDAPDVQFFPESGVLVHGLNSRIGFKAIDTSGQGEMVQGYIIDENDSIITSFESNSLGMGTFVLHKADSTKSYFARLKSRFPENEVLLYPLPGVASKGNSLSVEKQGDNILLSALSNYLKNDSINLNISFRGVSYYEMKVNLKEGIFKMLIPRDSLPEGIISFAMKDNALRTVAERLYFNERPDSRIHIELSSNKNVFTRRELTSLAIATTNSNGEPIHANVSLLVINKQQLGGFQSMRQNILSYFLLDSELKGEIENPGFYFSKESDKHSHLDALMLTQGWRKYHYSQEYRELVFQPETNLTVSGQISSVFSRGKKMQAFVTMMTFGENQSVYTQVADSLGKFNFNLNDEYGDNINVLIQSADKRGKKMNYTVTLDKKESPPVSFNHAKKVEIVVDVVQPFVEKYIEKKKIEDAFDLENGSILLDEVEVTSYRLTPNRKKVMEAYGEPDEVIDGKEILDKEEKWSYGLYSVLLFNYPDKVWIDREEDGNLRAKLFNREMTLVVIDGVPVKDYEYHLIPNIPPSEVSSFEIIEYAKNFLPLYCEVFSGNCAYAPAVGNVIAIYTFGQKGIYGTKKSVGVMQTSVPVFSATREFYAPKYENQQSHDWVIPDLRALIHWEPVLQTDSLGNASVSFYNADHVGKMVVVVEAVSENGEIGYQEMEYAIEGKDKQIIMVE